MNPSPSAHRPGYGVAGLLLAGHPVQPGLTRVLSNPLSSLSATDWEALRYPTRILVVDDQIRSRRDTEDVLTLFLRWALIESVASAAEALAAIGKRRPDLVFTAHSMPQMDGIDLTRHLKAQADSPLVIVMAADGSNGESQSACAAAGADFWFEKRHLQALLEKAFLRQRSGLGPARSIFA